MEVALYAVVLVLFATWVTLHTALSWRIARDRWWRGCLAWVVPPLAPWWGRGPLVVAWLACLTLYGLALFVGLL